MGGTGPLLKAIVNKCTCGYGRRKRATGTCSSWKKLASDNTHAAQNAHGNQYNGTEDTRSKCLLGTQSVGNKGGACIVVIYSKAWIHPIQ
jgi:hypothetical protein